MNAELDKCPCTNGNFNELKDIIDLGMDEHLGESTVRRCPDCSRLWLRYFYELEAIECSSRWFVGEISSERIKSLNAECAAGEFTYMPEYFYGGSYYDGRSGRTSGPIFTPQTDSLLAVLEDTRKILDDPDNDFSYSSWNSREDCLCEIDGYIELLESGTSASDVPCAILYLPTGPVQEVSISSGWGETFLDLANRFDAL